MRPWSRHFATLAAGAAVLLPAGCGSSEEPEGKPLPPGAVSELTRRLDEVQRRYEDGTNEGNVGACQDIESDSFREIDATVARLPADVDAEVRSALEESLARLRELTREGCSGIEDTRTEPEPAPPQTVPQQTIPQETIPQETETEPPKDEPPKKKEKDEGDGGAAPPDGGAGGLTAPLAPES